MPAVSAVLLASVNSVNTVSVRVSVTVRVNLV